MNYPLLYQFLLGLLVMSCAVAGLFFLRFYRRTHDQLFITFAFAFWLLGLNWLALTIAHAEELNSTIYLFRLAAFVLILFAIVQKNRTQS